MCATLSARLKDQLDEIREHNIATWRDMAKALADGNSPRPRDVLELAAALEVNNPGAAMEADAAAIRDRKAADAAIKLCHDTTAARLKAYGGRVEGLQAAAEKAATEAKRLHDLLVDATSCPESYWLHRVSQLERQHPRVFGEFPKPRPKFEDMEVFIG